MNSALEHTDDTLKQLNQQEALIERATLVGHAAATMTACSWWNIREHRLYRARGHKSMASYVESMGVSVNTVKKQLQRADVIADGVFDNTTAADARWLEH